MGKLSANTFYLAEQGRVLGQAIDPMMLDEASMGIPVSFVIHEKKDTGLLMAALHYANADGSLVQGPIDMGEPALKMRLSHEDPIKGVWYGVSGVEISEGSALEPIKESLEATEVIKIDNSYLGPLKSENSPLWIDFINNVCPFLSKESVLRATDWSVSFAKKVSQERILGSDGKKPPALGKENKIASLWSRLLGLQVMAESGMGHGDFYGNSINLEDGVLLNDFELGGPRDVEASELYSTLPNAFTVGQVDLAQLDFRHALSELSLYMDTSFARPGMQLPSFIKELSKNKIPKNLLELMQKIWYKPAKQRDGNREYDISDLVDAVGRDFRDAIEKITGNYEPGSAQYAAERLPKG